MTLPDTPAEMGALPALPVVAQLLEGGRIFASRVLDAGPEEALRACIKRSDGSRVSALVRESDALAALSQALAQRDEQAAQVAQLQREVALLGSIVLEKTAKITQLTSEKDAAVRWAQNNFAAALSGERALGASGAAQENNHV